MVIRIERVIRGIRRLLSRSEWAIRLLGLQVEREAAARPGLVMIQIDGLSHAEVIRAIEKGEMPFVKKLLERDRYHLHRHYSGIPASTPAVQGELFYGVKGAVPAFSFRDDGGQIVRMFEPGPTARLEKKLETKGRNLLEGGSAYSDIFTGGAAEPHFCCSAMGWGKLFKGANPLALTVLILSNGYSVLRIAFLLALEFLLALMDMVRGLIHGRDLYKELRFVPTRVGICILLRELVTIGAKIDVARGLPTVHLNLLGYDEQAHRRGPDSRMAHWALKGIDSAVARIWRAARRSTRRDYDIWVYSDHGQEILKPYPKVFGQSVHQSVADVFSRHIGVPDTPAGVTGNGSRGIQSQRIGLFGMGRLVRWLQPGKGLDEKVGENTLAVAAMGPLGMVYHPAARKPKQRRLLSAALVEEAHIPMVLYPGARGTAHVVTKAGEFTLPKDAAEVLGDDHPFRDEVAVDLVAVCHHEHAGDLVICGWARTGDRYNFPLENGSHGGPGPNETGAFALLPDDTPLPSLPGGYLRPLHLRQAAFNVLDAPVILRPDRTARQSAGRDTLRVLTYNVHGCIGMDDRASAERIARVIARHAPDVVALQELDEGRNRTGGIDQAHRIARHLEMAYQFHPVMHIEEGRYGNAILTHLPMWPVRAARLPGVGGKLRVEPRGAIWTCIRWGDTDIQVINTHMGLRESERRVQAAALLSDDWLGHPDCHSPVIVCGDFNALPGSGAHRLLTRHLRDVQEAAEGHRPKKTLPGRYPMARIDHVFVDSTVQVMGITVPATELEQVASDHLPLVVDLRLSRTENPTTPPSRADGQPVMSDRMPGSSCGKIPESIAESV